MNDEYPSLFRQHTANLGRRTRIELVRIEADEVEGKSSFILAFHVVSQETWPRSFVKLALRRAGDSTQ